MGKARRTITECEIECCTDKRQVTCIPAMLQCNTANWWNTGTQQGSHSNSEMKLPNFSKSIARKIPLITSDATLSGNFQSLFTTVFIYACTVQPSISHLFVFLFSILSTAAKLRWIQTSNKICHFLNSLKFQISGNPAQVLKWSKPRTLLNTNTLLLALYEQQLNT